MKRSVSCFLFLSCLAALTPLHAATTQSLTSYYPAPNGDYNKVQSNGLLLTPSTQADIQKLYNCSFLASAGLSPCPVGLIYFDTNTTQIMYSNGIAWLPLVAGSSAALDVGGYTMAHVMNIDGIANDFPNTNNGCSSSCGYTTPNTTSSSPAYSTSLLNGTYYMNDFNAGAPLINTYTSSNPNYVDNSYPEGAGWRVKLDKDGTTLDVNLEGLPAGTILVTYQGTIDVDQFLNEYEEEITAPAAVAGQYSPGVYGSFFDFPVPSPNGVIVALWSNITGSWGGKDATPLITDTQDNNAFGGTWDQATGVLMPWQNTDSYTPYSFSRTVAMRISSQSRTDPVVAKVELIIKKNGAVGTHTIKCGKSCSDTAWSFASHYDEPIAVKIENLSVTVQFQE